MADTPENSTALPLEEIRAKQPSLVGEVLSGRYRIDAELGVGGMGAVYRAEHTLMRKQLAIKVLHPEMTRLPEVVERFEREAMAAAHIEHPNVAAATDFGKLEDGSFFLVLEFVEGKSLRRALDEGPMDPARAVRISSQIVAALVRAHSLGIVHRDLKPDNIMLVDRDGDPDFVKVLDFGIAKVPVADISKEAGRQHTTLTKAGMVYGTPEYMAPEQALGQDVDARADLYALGIMLYEMLLARRPFESDSPVTLLGMQVTAAPPTFREVSPSHCISEELEKLVMGLLEKEAANRPSSAKKVKEALDHVGQHIIGKSPLKDATLGTHGKTQIVSSLNIPTPIAAEQVLISGANTIQNEVDGGINRVLDGANASSVDRKFQELERILPKPLQRVPVNILMGAAAGVGFLGLSIAGLVLWRTFTPTAMGSVFTDGAWPPAVVSSAVAQASRSAGSAKVAVATEQGLGALEDLFQQYPGDPAVLQPLAKARLNGVAPIASIEIYKKLFNIEPEKVNDRKLRQTLTKAAGKKSSQDAAFEVMLNHMGTAGPDLIYDIVVTKKGANRTAIARAAKLIKSDAIKKNASPALLIALDLRKASGCQAKHRLLDRAKKYGDERTSVQLRGLFHNMGCGFLGLRDCWRCMRNDRKLGEAVNAIDERTKSKK